jgi:hypothetical protein
MTPRPHLTWANNDQPEEPGFSTRTFGRRNQIPFLTPDRRPRGIGPGWKPLLDGLYYDLKNLDGTCVI